MKDINAAITKKYFETLSGNVLLDSVPVPVYYKYIPENVNADNYLLITSVFNGDASTKQSSNTETTIQLSIYTRQINTNDGVAADDIAAQIFTLLYPDKNFKLDLSPDFYIVSTKMVNNVSPDAIETGAYVFINRHITFRHYVNHA